MHLGADTAAGAEVAFEVVASPSRLHRTPLYCYRPLTGVFIDDRRVSEWTPVHGLTVPVGRHRVSIFSPDRNERSPAKEVVVTAGAIAPYAAHAVFQDELRLRLDSFARPKREVRWTPHKQLLAEVRKNGS